MNLALIIEHFNQATGGAEGFAITVFKQLVKRGHTVKVFATTGNSTPDIEVNICDLSQATSLARESGADLVIDWGLNVEADLHRLGGGVHTEFQRISLNQHPLKFFKKLSQAISSKHRRIIAEETRLINANNCHLLAVSDFVRQQVINFQPQMAEHTHTIINGVDTERFKPSAEYRQQIRQELGLKENDVAFLFVAHNLKLKNIDLLKKLFPKLPANAKLILLGKRDPKIKADWFIYAGKTSKPEQFYTACNALIHPTYYDACANVVLEALACGLPVLSSTSNGSAEVITDGREGYKLSVDCPISEQISIWLPRVKELIQNAELRQQMSIAARTCAENNSISNYINKFEELLASII